MKRGVGALVVMALVLGAAPGAAAAAPYVPGEVIVRFAPGVDAGERAALRREHDVRAVEGLGLPRLQLVRTDGTVGAAIAALEGERGVLYAEPNYLHEPTATPDDPFYEQQWGLHNTGQQINTSVPFEGTADTDIDAPEAWDIETGSSDVVVAVVDSGVAYDYPDLEDNIWTNPGETPGNSVDDDGNGQVDDVRGWDFFANDNEPLDSNRHGTLVSGIIGAGGDNDREMTGVNWDVTIMPVRVGSAWRADISSANIAAGFTYAAENGADVVNASFGASALAQSVADAVAAAPDVLFVAAAGNDAADNDTAGAFPCNLSAANLICVAATDQDDELAAFSNFGDQNVDLAAPGATIVAPTIGLDDPVFTEGFESDFATRWTTAGSNNTWGTTTTQAAVGTSSLADSPSADYVNGTTSIARNTNAIDLDGGKGCSAAMRLKMDTRTETQIVPPGAAPRDDFVVLASPTSGGSGAVEAGRRNGTLATFTDLGFDLSNLDGDATSFLFLGLSTNTDGLNADGVYVDDIHVRCLVETYPPDDDAPLVYSNGTSVAAPFVTGVAALLLADDPTLTVAQLRSLILDNVDEVPALDGKVATGGRLNAARALGGDPDAPPVQPPDDDDPDPPAPPVDDPPPAAPFTPPPVAPDTIAPVLELSGSTRQRVRAGRVTIAVRCPAETCTVRGTGRRLRAGTATAQAGGTTRLVLKIGQKARRAIRRALRRGRTVRVTVTVIATDAAGNTTTKRRTIRLRR